MSERVEKLRKSSGFAEEKLVATVQSLLQQKLNDRGMNRADLATKMGVSRARVSQIFSDNQNFTLRMVAKAFHALGESLEISCSSGFEVKSLPHCDAQSVDVEVDVVNAIFDGTDDFGAHTKDMNGKWREISTGPILQLDMSAILEAFESIIERRAPEGRPFRRTKSDEGLIREWTSANSGENVISLFGDRGEVVNG